MKIFNGVRKIDAVLAAIIGFLNGAFFLFILGQAKIKIPYSWLLIIIFPTLAAIGLFVASIIGKKLPIIFQAAKFFLVGTLNTFIDLGVLNILILITATAAGLFYSIFKTISFVGATINSYFWNKFWTFEKKGTSPPKEFLKFVALAAIGLLINVSVASFVVNIIGPQFGMTANLWATLGAIVAAFFAFVWNFLASKFLVFK